MTKNKKAFSLIEILIVMFIASVVFTSFYMVSTVGTKFIIQSKNRLAATALANEQMEIVRNLPYEKVGTVGNLEVPGNLSQDVDITANGHSYHVSTTVRYVDDPMDGTISSSPADVIPNDYKNVDIIVSWNDGNGQTQDVASTSRFVPPGLETSMGGSPLSINVSGDDTSPVQHAIVHITNTVATPNIDDVIQTDNEGHILLPAARISTGNHVTVTKSGYETIETMDATATFIPLYGHISVISGFLNTYNFFLNKLAKLTVVSADYQNNPVGDIDFSIGGGKILGHDDFNQNVLSMATTTATTETANGEMEYPNISSGNYTVTMDPAIQDGHEFVDFEPSVTPFFLAPDADSTYTMRVASTTVTSLFLTIKKNDATQNPVSGAKVTLTDSEGVDIFVEKLSSLRGVVFYPDSTNPLTSGTYTLKVDAEGYVLETKSIVIESDKINHDQVDLTAN